MEDSIAALRCHHRVSTVVGHMCQYGMKCTDPQGVERPVLKPTRWIGSATEVLKRLSRRCPGGHKHTQLLGAQRTRGAAVYPARLCQEILIGVQQQLKRESRDEKKLLQVLLKLDKVVYDLSDSEKLEALPESDDLGLEDWHPEEDRYNNQGNEAREEEEGEMDRTQQTETFRDTVTGEVIPTTLVQEACKEEVEFMDEWGVGELKPISEAKKRTGKRPITGKWVLRNKGDKQNPIVRCLHVAREVSLWKDDCLFVVTPPLEALRGFFPRQLS